MKIRIDDVPVVVRRIDERRLGEVHLPREPLELVLGNPARVGEDRELVAGERLIREDVADDVAETSAIASTLDAASRHT